MTTKNFFVVPVGLCAALWSQGAIALPAPEPHIGTASGQYTTNHITVEGIERPDSGVTSIQYLLNGSGPYTALQPNTNNWNKWDAAVTLNPGSNIFEVWAVATNGLSHTNTARYFLVVKSPITVSVAGSGRVVPNYNGKELVVGRSYTMVAVPAAGQVFVGWAGSAKSHHADLNFLMQEGEDLVATFEAGPFTNGLPGVYEGLFYDTNNLSEASSGYLTLTLAGKLGIFSGSMTLDGRTMYFGHQFDSSGNANLTILRSPAKGDLSLSLSLDMTGTNGLTGTVICTNASNTFNATLQAYKIVRQNTNYAGYYTWAMDGSLAIGGTGPGGYSYGTVILPRQGNATVDVNLSEGYSTVLSSGLTAEGLLPLYLSLDGGHASLSGWLKFETNDLTFNSMQWFENPAALGTYTNGFALTNLSLALSPYTKGTNTLGTTNVVVYLTGGDLGESLTDSVSLGAGAHFPSGNTNSVVVSLDLKTGIFSGTFTDPTDDKKTKFQGALVQPTSQAFGFFLPTNHLGGAAAITAAPAP